MQIAVAGLQQAQPLGRPAPRSRSSTSGNLSRKRPTASGMTACIQSVVRRVGCAPIGTISY